MRPLRLLLGAGLVVACASAAGLPLQAAPQQAAASASAVDPAALAALERMSTYLKTLTAFEITAETSLDLVTEDNEKLKLDGVNKYLVRRPDNFMVEVATDWRVRRLTYDGKTLTLSAPELKFYASAPVTGTSRSVLDRANENYGLTLPLADLFSWTDPTHNNRPAPTSALGLGAAKIGGVETERFAFREEDVDWQIWIQKGDKPVPLKIVITDRTDPTLPQYSALLRWNTAPQFTADTFTFRPEAGAMRIQLSSKTSQ